MALFCASCKKLSRIVGQSSRVMEDLSAIRNWIRPPSRRSINHNKGSTTVLLKSKDIKLKWADPYVLTSARAIYTFTKLESRSTGGSPKDVLEQNGAEHKGKSEDLTEEEQKLLEELEEEGLTEEECKVLRELKEEERQRKEELLSSEDYSLWEGDVGTGKDDKRHLTGSVSEEYVHFENRQRVIQDVIEEMWNPLPEEVLEKEEAPVYPRGKTGVFDLGELIDLLRDENADEVVAITLPKEIDYADYMVIVTVRHNRQLVALATFVRKRFKLKDRKSTDRLPFFDKSVKHDGWVALDLGNIILHIFIPEIRDYYDLETLWTVGPVFDDLYNAKDPEIVQLLNALE
ncbi:Mitochondrial assembly of ribosomal large subunit protein 1 [Orchesella cincta]|uniref:Mitochondrial assembly of ribosomal large subunit protein 1 n=1 Tax=Orchesella cincta TaxID=48709 RepID=A0A1D2NGE4_ORCCI|nr:Mitochondrial assembly of ribosomal large subunit protein 1 [Orchesella cincta]